MNSQTFNMCTFNIDNVHVEDDAFTTSNSKEKVSRTSSSQSSNSRGSVPKCIDKSKTLLPVDFEPTGYTIICGNKRQYFNSVGNRRLRVLVKNFIPQYNQANGKLEKSFIVTKVMNIIREACPVGAFVAMEKGRWWQVSERTSREKVGSYFRDCLAGKYKSSAQNKIARRKTKREEKKQIEAVEDLPESVASLYAQTQLIQKQQLQMQLQLMMQTQEHPSHSNNHNDGDCSSVSSATSASFFDVDDLCNVPLLEL